MVASLWRTAAPAPLVAGMDYPSTHAQLMRMFADEAAYESYLERLRWPEGFFCSKCGVFDEPWRTGRGLMCRHCRAQQRVRSGTIFDQTKTPLTTWFVAAWLVTAPKSRMSAKTLERTLGVSYHTAWAMLQRFRVAMVRSERERLRGTVGCR